MAELEPSAAEEDARRRRHAKWLSHPHVLAGLRTPETPSRKRAGARPKRCDPFPVLLHHTEEAKREMAQDIASEVKRIIKEQLDVEEKDIKPESTFIEDLGADSLGLVELVLAFEEAFEIDIPDEDTEKIRTVQDAVDYIEKHAKK